MLAIVGTLGSGKPVARPPMPSARRPTLAIRDILAPLSSPSNIITMERDTEIVAQGQQAEYCLQIIEGCVRTSQILEDGRRQIGDFLFAGDVFGCDSLDAYEYGAEAVTPVKLRRLRLSVVEDRANSDLQFAQLLRHYSAAQLKAARGRLVLLGRKTARERVACFLLDMATRLPEVSSTVIDLPMSRVDIADYLGLTTETVCRSLTDLRHQRVITVERGRITILDHGGLARTGLGHLQ